MVITHGELLIDFVPTVTGVGLIDAPAFIKAPGGAPANVAAGLARLGTPAAFLGQVGDDAFGHFLAATLRDVGVDIGLLSFSKEARTALAFVSLRADGERDFMFYRHPSADMLYAPRDVELHAAALRKAEVFHFGSISLIGEPARAATLRAVVLACEGGALISYDPNLRLPLWPSAEAAREGMWRGLREAHVLKIAEEELAFLTGTTDEDEAIRQIWHPRLRLVAITRGSEGSEYITEASRERVASLRVEAVDTTGSGDAFMAGLLSGLLSSEGFPAGQLTASNAVFSAPDAPARLRGIVRRANVAGALTATRRGAIPAMPFPEAVQSALRTLAKAT